MTPTQAVRPYGYRGAHRDATQTRREQRLARVAFAALITLAASAVGLVLARPASSATPQAMVEAHQEIAFNQDLYCAPGARDSDRAAARAGIRRAYLVLGEPYLAPTCAPAPSPTATSTSSPSPPAPPPPTPPGTPPAGCVKPDATNTGPAPMTVLTPSGGLSIPAGTTRSGLDITGNVTVRGTLLHSQIRGTLSVLGAGRVEHVSVNGQGAGIVVYAQGASDTVRATMRYLNVHNGSDGGRFDGWVLMEYSWVHGLLTGPGAHSDGVQSTGGPYQTYRCNRVEGGNTSSFIIANDGCGCGDPAHVVFDRNWFEGQSGPGWTTSYAVYANGGASDFRFTGNVFSRVGGTVRDYPGDAVTVWTENVYTDGAPVSRP